VTGSNLRTELRRHARAALESGGVYPVERAQLCRQVVAAALIGDQEHPSSVAYRALEELVDIALADEEILLALDEIT
jgi:hypothetical protein